MCHSREGGNLIGISSRPKPVPYRDTGSRDLRNYILNYVINYVILFGDRPMIGQQVAPVPPFVKGGSPEYRGREKIPSGNLFVTESLSHI